MKYAVLNKTPLIPALQQLRKVKLSSRTALNLLKMARKIDFEAENLRTFFFDTLKKHCNLDEAGNPKAVEGKWDFTTSDGEAEVNKAMEEFHELEFDFDFPKISMSELAHVQLSMDEIQALEPILNHLEAKAST